MHSWDQQVQVWAPGLRIAVSHNICDEHDQRANLSTCSHGVPSANKKTQSIAASWPRTFVLVNSICTICQHIFEGKMDCFQIYDLKSHICLSERKSALWGRQWWHSIQVEQTIDSNDGSWSLPKICLVGGKSPHTDASIHMYDSMTQPRSFLKSHLLNDFFKGHHAIPNFGFIPQKCGS